MIIAGDRVPGAQFQSPWASLALREMEMKPRGSSHGESFQDLLGADPAGPRGVCPVCHHRNQPCTSRSALCPPYHPGRCLCAGGGWPCLAAAAEAQRPPRSPGRLPGGASEERSCEGPHQAAAFPPLSVLSPGLVAGLKNSTKGPLSTKDF